MAEATITADEKARKRRNIRICEENDEKCSQKVGGL
jgi:hypothetical protein